MIIKTRDADDRVIESLEWRARIASDRLLRVAYMSAAARLRADPTTQFACDFIDKYFGDSDDWAVIHDLRFRVGSRALQLNHVLISNALDIVCVDSRYMLNGLDFHETDKCDVRAAFSSKPISSPLNKMSRDVRLITKHVHASDVLPRKFGIGPRALVTGYVIIDPNPRLKGKEPTSRESVFVLSSDALFPLLWKKDLHWSQSKLEQLGPKALRMTAERLVMCHESTVPAELLVETKVA